MPLDYHRPAMFPHSAFRAKGGPMEKGQLRGKSVASPPPPKNPYSGTSNSDKPCKIREEGEVTSSSEEDHPTTPGAPSTATSIAVSSLVSKTNTTTNGDTHVKSGILMPGKCQAGYVDIQSRVTTPPVRQKGNSLKCKVPTNSSRSVWKASQGNNLIISFSDDSGSDSESHRPQKGPSTGGANTNSSKKHAPPLDMGLECAQQPLKKGQVFTKKVSISQALASSMPRSSAPRPRTVRSSSVEPRYCSTHSTSVGKNLANQDLGHFKVDLSDSKLQDLRQQIAMRENELKLKSVQTVLHNKENCSDPYRESSDWKHNSTSTKIRPIGSDSRLEPNEPVAKRVRLASNSSRQLYPAVQDETSLKFIVPSNELVLESKENQVATTVHHKEGEEYTDSKQLPNSFGVPQQERHCVSSLTASKSRKDKCFTGSSISSDFISTPGPISQMSKLTALSASVSSDKPSEPLSVGRLDVNDRLCYTHNQAKSGDDASKNHDRQAMLGFNKCKLDSHLQVNPVQDLASHPDRDATLLSLIEAEELHDKQLEEAQEHRHRCEIEERNAFRAYRKAQRALAKANAQCSNFYRMRELFSAHVRSFMMDDSNLLSSNQHEQFGPRWNFSCNVSGDDADPCTALVDEMHAARDAGNQICYNSHVQSAEAETQNRNSPNDRLNVGSEPVSEPDSSTSELLPQKDKEALYALSPTNDPNVSSDEYEQVFLQSGDSSMKFLKDKSQQRKTETMVDNLAPTFSGSSLEESMKREAQLRSELFSRLRMPTSLTKSSLSGISGNRIEKVVEVDAMSGRQNILSPTSMSEHHDHCVGSAGDHMIMGLEKDGGDYSNISTQFVVDNALLSNQGQNCISDLGGSDAPCRRLSKFQQVDQNSMTHLADVTANLEDCRSQSTGGSKFLLSATIFRSALQQMKFSCPKIMNPVLNSNDSTSYRRHKDVTLCSENVGDWLIGGIDSYSCNSVIDPLWPLCMHELRGKCNDEECPYQHTKDCSRINIQQHQGPQSGLTAIGEKLKGGRCISLISTPPAYLVCFNGPEFDSRRCDPILSQTFQSCGTEIFSISLAVSVSLLRNLYSYEPCLHGNHGSVEAHTSYRKSVYIQKRCDSMTGPDYNIQILETALTNVDSSEGKIKLSLSMLTRALEDDPTCPHIWVVYLLIYYSDKNKAENEDFFSSAVKHNEASYVLWLLYINSRRHLKDLYAAYERSISSLCHTSSSEDIGCHSAFILDLFLQMLHSYIISGNAGKAVKRISGLIMDEKDADSAPLSDVLECLVISDKYVFWVSCVHVVIYRKLPDIVVQWFEFEKDIILIDWPCVKLEEEQKELVYKLIDVALPLSVPPADLVSLDDKKNAVEAAQRFALSHIKLVEAIDGLESSKKLLEKYISKYPSCLKLVLLLARIRCDDDCGQGNFSGFEEALMKWPKEVPGIQCIWNQYVEYVLRTGGLDAAKDVLVRWSDCFAKDLSVENVFADDKNDDDRNDHLTTRSVLSLYASGSRAAKIDLIYGLLNLSLCWLMQDNVVRAQDAIVEVMKTGEGEYLIHCIRERAVFLLNYGTQVGSVVSTSEIMDLLRGCMDSVHLPFKEPLSRKFIQQIQKPRVRKLVEGILSPLLPDFSVLNVVLESWFGPSLLPRKCERTKDMVDLVESVLDISPANYPLAISACKILLQQPEVDGVSTSFWASLILVSTIFRCVPVPPEYVWVEASGLLGMLKGADEAARKHFYQKALSVYPFSLELWKSYVSSLDDESRTNVVEAAREKGIEL